MCKFCDEYEIMHEDTDDAGLLELWVNKARKSLEVHYCGQFTVLDYEDIPINYCPMCGKKLLNK